jgi:hypothetical protein
LVTDITAHRCRERVALITEIPDGCAERVP